MSWDALLNFLYMFIFFKGLLLLLFFNVCRLYLVPSSVLASPFYFLEFLLVVLAPQFSAPGCHRNRHVCSSRGSWIDRR